MAGLLFSCKKPEQEQLPPEEEEPMWTENTGEITYKMAPSAAFTAEGGEKTIRFSCTESWHIECEASWLSFDPERAEGNGEKQTFKVVVSAGQNTERSSRKADVSIVSGESRYSFTAAQNAPVITLSDEEISEKGIDISRIYTPITGSIDKLRSSGNEFYLGRARTSEHFIVLWDKGYDESGEVDPASEETPAGIRVDVDDLLKKAEIYYDTYVTKLGMRGPEGDSYLDKYYMTICLYGTTNWKAEGGGSGNMGGLWVSATACQPTGSTIAHEIGHAFQYQVYADYGSRDAGFMQVGGLFWEACANWQSYNLYAEQAFNSENFRVFTENHMRHFHHEHQRYASYWFMFHLTDLWGWEGYGKLWKESKRTEDGLQAYQRLFCNGELMTLNRHLYDYAAKCATWDFDSEVVNLDEQAHVTRKAPVRDFGEPYIGKLGWVSDQTSDGYYQVGYARAPEATGFNVIRLNVPEGGSKISADFVGLPNAQGYNTVKVDDTKAGWHYGFVALLANGDRIYGEPVFTGSELKGSVSWTIPDGTEKLWLIVACTPSRYYTHTWDEDDTNDSQWPYKVRFSGTNLYGTIAFTGDEQPHDAEIIKDIDISAADGYAGPAVILDMDDLVEIGKAFVLQPTEIASMIPADRANISSAQMKFAALLPDGTLSYNYTANGYGFWFASDGSVVSWGSDAYAFSEFSPSSWTFQLGTYPDHAAPGEDCTIRQALVYGGHMVTLTFRLHIN